LARHLSLKDVLKSLAEDAKNNDSHVFNWHALVAGKGSHSKPYGCVEKESAARTLYLRQWLFKKIMEIPATNCLAPLKGNINSMIITNQRAYKKIAAEIAAERNPPPGTTAPANQKKGGGRAMLTDIQSYELKLEKRVDETDDSAVGQKKKTPSCWKKKRRSAKIRVGNQAGRSPHAAHARTENEPAHHCPERPVPQSLPFEAKETGP
jgi:hypothetical protein